MFAKSGLIGMLCAVASLASGALLLSTPAQAAAGLQVSDASLVADAGVIAGLVEDDSLDGLGNRRLLMCKGKSCVPPLSQTRPALRRPAPKNVDHAYFHNAGVV